MVHSNGSNICMDSDLASGLFPLYLIKFLSKSRSVFKETNPQWCGSMLHKAQMSCKSFVRVLELVFIGVFISTINFTPSNTFDVVYLVFVIDCKTLPVEILSLLFLK